MNRSANGVTPTYHVRCVAHLVRARASWQRLSSGPNTPRRDLAGDGRGKMLGRQVAERCNCSWDVPETAGRRGRRAQRVSTQGGSMFNAYRVFNEHGKITSRIVPQSLDGLNSGSVLIKAAFSSVNYKDALAVTGAGKVVRRWPLTAGIDVAGVVESSNDPNFSAGDPVLVTGYELGVSHDGGYAGYVRVPGDWVVPLPLGLSLFESMAIGTAGFTAALSIVEMERNGLVTSKGPVIVTGATGGVGSIAVQALATRGYSVTALTGKAHEADYLRTLGASDVLLRNSLEMGTRPLEAATWAGAVDPVGGEVLAWLTRTMLYGGVIANSGLTAGTDLSITVLPFILRTVKLIGIDSVMCPATTRREIWGRLAGDLKPNHLSTATRTVSLEELPDTFATLLAGKARGRFVVDLCA